MYRFTRTIWTDDAAGNRVQKKNGDLVAAEDILPGCLEACLATGDLVKIDVPQRPKEDAAPVDEGKDKRIKRPKEDAASK